LRIGVLGRIMQEFAAAARHRRTACLRQDASDANRQTCGCAPTCPAQAQTRKKEKRRFSESDRCLLHSRVADASDPAAGRNVLRKRFMGGRILSRPWSDEANLFERGLAPGAASQLTRGAVRLSPVFPLSGDEPPPEDPQRGRGYESSGPRALTGHRHSPLNRLFQPAGRAYRYRAGNPGTGNLGTSCSFRR
jgi:hypothetical protein